MKRQAHCLSVFTLYIYFIFQVIVLLVILVMRKRIKLVIQLFKEAGRAINSMPLLFLEPLLVCYNACTSYVLQVPLFQRNICLEEQKENWTNASR